MCDLMKIKNNLIRPLFISEMHFRDSAFKTDIKINLCTSATQTIEQNLSEIEFSVKGNTTIVTDGKFWKKILYTNGNETNVSEEIGDAYQRIQLL